MEATMTPQPSVYKLLPGRKLRNTCFKVMGVWLGVLIILAVVSMLASCQATPARHALITVEAATATANTVADAFEAHLITQSQLKALLPYADAVYAAQKDLLKAQADGKTDLAGYWTALNDAVLTLLNKKSELKNP